MGIDRTIYGDREAQPVDFPYYDETREQANGIARAGLVNGRAKIDTIKEVRTVCRYGLKESKDIVDAIWALEGASIAGRANSPLDGSRFIYVTSALEDFYRFMNSHGGFLTPRDFAIALDAFLEGRRMRIEP